MHNGYYLFHVTPKHHLDDFKTIKGQQFILCTFDLVIHSDNYSKNPKYSDTQNICCNHPKIWTR